MSANKSTNYCVTTETFDVSKLQVKLTTNDVDRQKKKTDRPYYYAQVFYEYEPGVSKPLAVKTDVITLLGGGIPSKTDKDGKPSKWYPTDDKRQFFRITFNPKPDDKDPKGNAELRKKILKPIDEYMEKNKLKILEGRGKFAKDYKYSKLSSLPELTEEMKEKLTKELWERLRVNFLIDYQSTNTQNVGRDIVTKVYIKEDGMQKQIDAKTVSDIEKYVKWNSEIKCLLTFDRLQVSTGSNTKVGYSYSIKASCAQLVVTSQGRGAVAIQDIFRDNIFGEEGDVEKPTDKKVIKPVKKVEKKKEESEKESDDESEDEKEDVKKTDKLVDDDSNAAEEKSDDEESDEEEEEEKPKKPIKKPTKKPAKKVESDSEDEDD